MIVDKILIINLKRSNKRWNNMQKIIKRTDIPSIRIDAIDGKILQKNPNWYNLLYKNRLIMGKTLKKSGTAACFMSHRKAWKYIVNNNLKSAIILEDDCKMNIKPPKNMPNVELIWLHNLIKIKYDFALKRNKLSGYGAQAYCLSKRGAKKLLYLTHRMKNHVDLRMIDICNARYIKWLISNNNFFSHGNFSSDRENS